jgi:putative transposase
MARGPRLDCPGAVHHLRARGIERRPIFQDDVDRTDFLARLASLSRALRCPVYAWVLMPNHVHLVVRSGALGLSTFGRRLLGGYASWFNRRHGRAGYLFQGRFKSTLVDADSYLLELVRYVHLNPVRAGLVSRLEDLDHNAWSGHAALVGTHPNDWQETGFVLQQFAASVSIARRRYREFVAAGSARHQPAAKELVYPSQPFSRTSGARTRGREEWTLDEWILGDDDFTAQIRADITKMSTSKATGSAAQLQETIERSCAAGQVAVEEVRSPSKRPHLVSIRREICARAVLELGLPVSQVAATLRISARTVLRAVDRKRLGVGIPRR